MHFSYTDFAPLNVGKFGYQCPLLQGGDSHLICDTFHRKASSLGMGMHGSNIGVPNQCTDSMASSNQGVLSTKNPPGVIDGE